MENLDRWDIIDEFKYGRRKYFSVVCSVCNTSHEKVRSDSLERRVCKCNEKVKGKPISSGTVFGKLTVIERSKYNGKNVFYNVECECGVVKELQSSQLLSGNTLSCGCSLTEKRGSPRENHGKTGTKEYKVWCSVVNRTTRPTESTREWYFDKGIKVSPEWRASFTAFLEDMGPCPENYTLDRIDPNGDYSKNNCRWASIDLQSINKGLFKNNTSGKTGVSLNQHGKYMAYIYRKGERIHLGSHDTYESAVAARLAGEEKYWGEINE